MENLPSSPGTESATVSELATPLSLSGRASPLSNDDSLEPAATTQKKKKKKKSKKSSTSKLECTTSEAAKDPTSNEGRSPVLCISRNKHWKYISSYHGPWLQLPVELLDTLLTVNLNPATMLASEIRLVLPGNGKKSRDRGLLNTSDYTPPESPQANTHSSLLLPPPSLLKPNKVAPPQIDPGVFQSVLNIRRLIDEASGLSVRATSGLSSAELGSLRSSSGMTVNSWATAQSLGFNPLGNTIGGGRNVTMSATRIYRLRAMAVQKLAQAYKTDEIASSVMVMQGGSVFDDIAERVLKVDPDDVDAKYVQFFHEKIPSRQLAESTTTKVLDELIAAHPQTLEYYRTRGIVHCFRDEFTQAIKDFTFALKETRSIRKAKLAHHESVSIRESKQGRRRRGKAAHRTNGQAPAEGTSVMENDIDSSDKEATHASSSDDVPSPLEPQLLFFRGAAYLQQAIYLIETAILNLEGIRKCPSADGTELRLCYLENGKYGGVEIGNSEGPLGKRDGAKLQAYAATLGEKTFKDHISQLLKRCMRDHERFQSHFDFLESDVVQEGDLLTQIQHAFQVVETNYRHTKEPSTNAASNAMEPPAMFATYHPLLIESLFAVLICHLMLADFEAILPLFIRAAAITEGTEGYPVFLPPRSMAQAEFVEVLERLARGWKKGTQPHSLSNRGKGRVVVAEKFPLKPAPSTIPPSPPVSRSESYNEPEFEVVAGSSSTRFGYASINSLQSFNALTVTLDSSQTPISIEERRSDAAEALNCARILIAPLAKRQRDLAQKLALEKAGSKSTKTAPISIPLHGPKVEVILAWLGAVHLPELDG